MQTDTIEKELPGDVILVQKIPIISKILDVICQTTGMGFAAVARVTEDKWITCSVRDDIHFGLNPGDELKVETTICHEIRQAGKPVIIDHVDKDQFFCNHATPLMYGFQSYISVPILRRDGSFFGTLCAIDPKPARLNTPETSGMFALFSELISFHLHSIEQLQLSDSRLISEREVRVKEIEQKNIELQKMNLELESFAHVASHDLQEPLRKIETFTNLIFEKDYDTLSENGRHYFDRLKKSVKRMQTLIRDLIMYSQVKVQKQVFEKTSLSKIAEDVKQNFKEELSQKHILMDVSNLCSAFIIPFQFHQLLQNLIGNSIKFSRRDIDSFIHITSAIVKGDNTISEKLSPQKFYCHIIIRDNGIGFAPQHSEKIFEVFQRLNGREEYDGTGIGLSIVKKIVDNHEGFITATGEPDKGATFEIYIPQP